MSAASGSATIGTKRTVARFRLLNRSAGKKITGVTVEANDPPVPLELDPLPPLEISPDGEYRASSETAPTPIHSIRVQVTTDPPPAGRTGFAVSCILPDLEAVDEILAILGPVPDEVEDSLSLRVSWIDAHAQLCCVITPRTASFFLA
jgi:hypothetical protein